MVQILSDSSDPVRPIVNWEAIKAWTTDGNCEACGAMLRANFGDLTVSNHECFNDVSFYECSFPTISCPKCEAVLAVQAPQYVEDALGIERRDPEEGVWFNGDHLELLP